MEAWKKKQNQPRVNSISGRSGFVPDSQQIGWSGGAAGTSEIGGSICYCDAIIRPRGFFPPVGKGNPESLFPG